MLVVFLKSIVCGKEIINLFLIILKFFNTNIKGVMISHIVYHKK